MADPYGAWIVVSTHGEDPPLWGEFLAVEADSAFVLVGTEVRGVPVDGISHAELAWYDAEWGKLGWWTGVGSISTLSHGYFLILSFPVWVIGGSLAARVQSRAPLLRVERADEWDGARMYARFPAGLPPDLPRTLPARPRR